MGCENNCMNEHRIRALEDDFKEFKLTILRIIKSFTIVLRMWKKTWCPQRVIENTLTESLMK